MAVCIGVFLGFSDVSCHAIISCYFLIAIQISKSGSSKIKTQPHFSSDILFVFCTMDCE